MDRIPVSRMLQSEREKLLKLEDELHHRVIGQHEAIQAVANAFVETAPDCRTTSAPSAHLSSWAPPCR
jgi:ATP-dependent Clp protease ATP-binding subunit ClpB